MVGKLTCPLAVSGKFIQVEGIEKRTPILASGVFAQYPSGLSTNVDFGILGANAEDQ